MIFGPNRCPEGGYSLSCYSNVSGIETRDMPYSFHMLKCYKNKMYSNNLNKYTCITLKNEHIHKDIVDQ